MLFLEQMRCSFHVTMDEERPTVETASIVAGLLTPLRAVASDSYLATS
jgi:hypothetical protein